VSAAFCRNKTADSRSEVCQHFSFVFSFSFHSIRGDGDAKQEERAKPETTRGGERLNECLVPHHTGSARFIDTSAQIIARAISDSTRLHDTHNFSSSCSALISQRPKTAKSNFSSLESLDSSETAANETKKSFFSVDAAAMT
jgi:hypothetical protein